ncbi:hypothetical protein MO867_17895 [Microbulbifer sp. OS29]|uniref:Uncharacterized protein n=1 Tax=Microbulbifer okhotskensis TaxID=2926617 RepID=A0A9X2EQY4_9GAMM|nr:hypothetical protein [Microbulbifer okhotskensis]MCO1336206.1 hypothetical protein [Microbulbifer okhotskensis]
MNTTEFNNQYPPGTPVIYVDDFGKETHTNTRSIAWDVYGTAVVKIEGKAGGVALERVNPCR